MKIQTLVRDERILNLFYTIPQKVFKYKGKSYHYLVPTNSYGGIGVFLQHDEYVFVPSAPSWPSILKLELALVMGFSQEELFQDFYDQINTLLLKEQTESIT